MICIDNFCTDPWWNLAVEETLATLYPAETVWMLWQNIPTVVCGKFQNIYEEISLPLVLDAGVAVARRNTGGGTVYHDAGNLNYTVITPRKEVSDGYAYFLTPVVRALRSLGVPAETGGVCDILAEGGKISGNAQAVIGASVLHHGTLLFDTDLSALHRFTARDETSFFSSRAIRSRPSPVRNIKAYCSPEMTMETLRTRLWEALSHNTPPRKLNETEKNMANRLADEKYRTWEWNFGHSPAFSFLRNWNGVEIAYTAKHGRIAECTIGGKPIPALSGVALSRPELHNALSHCGCASYPADVFLG